MSWALRIAALVAAFTAAAVLTTPWRARAAAPAVAAFPGPTAHVASPQTQIAFRGVPASQLGSIVVTGSITGQHTGTIESDSDGQGGSFVPAAPFAPGEMVTVTTSLNIVGANGGTYNFTVATPARGFPTLRWPAAARVKGDVQYFASRRDLRPASVKLLSRSRRSSLSDVFLAPQWGPLQDGPMIVDPWGKLIWFHPLTGADSAADFRVQAYRGAPVLTWWQGNVAAGVGTGEDMIYDSSYRQVAVVRAANGLSADMHEFQLTPQGTALITAYYPVRANASSVHGSQQQVVLDSVVQEIDIPTGLVLFQWDSMDQVPLSDSFAPVPHGKNSANSPFDYFHVNSIEQDQDGNLLISARNTWAAYKVNRQTGAILWRLGGRHSSFKLAAGTYWAFQHDVRARSNGDRILTLFDDDAGPPTIHRQSRAITLSLDLKHWTAHQVASYAHSPSLSTNFQGNFQQLPGGDAFIGWGSQPFFTEFDSHGRIVFDARFTDSNISYRAYRFAWNALPLTPPDVALSKRGANQTVYVSWNGVTIVRAWRVLGGSTATNLTTVKTATKTNFETAITIPSRRYVAVQALSWSGQVLGTSAIQGS